MSNAIHFLHLSFLQHIDSELFSASVALYVWLTYLATWSFGFRYETYPLAQQINNSLWLRNEKIKQNNTEIDCYLKPFQHLLWWFIPIGRERKRARNKEKQAEERNNENKRELGYFYL